MNILIVEDDPNLQTLWRRELCAVGATVTAAETAHGARMALSELRFDVVVIDLYVGREPGLAVAALASSVDPSCKIVIVAGATDIATEHLVELSPSIVGVLRKPVDIEQLIEVTDAIRTARPLPRDMITVRLRAKTG